MSTLLYFAGAEAHHHRLVPRRVDAMMFSYLKIWKKNPKINMPGLRKARAQGATCCLDSGAHTFQTHPEFGKYTQTYKRQYFRYLEHYHDQYEFVVELDIDHIIGLEEMYRWRAELRDLGIDNFIPVWHHNQGPEMWLKLCKEYDYVGTQTKIKLVSLGELWANLRIASEHGTKVHGFGLSEPQPICLFFDSLDSTSWLRSARFAILDWFGDMGTKQSWGHMHHDRLAQTKFVKGQKKSFRNMDTNQKLHISIAQWKRYALYLKEQGLGTAGLRDFNGTYNDLARR
jgi:hypothetical protein